MPVFSTSALVLLLFEGAIDVRVEELRRAARSTLLLTCVSFLLSMLAVAALLLVRPWAVRTSLSPDRTSRRDASVAAVLAPKGLAAAVLATLPAQRGLPDGERIATVVGAVVVVSIVASSVLAALAARREGLPVLRALFGSYEREPGPEPAAPEEKPKAAAPDVAAA